MRLTHEVILEQQQKLMMTPELRQAIAILQMSSQELGEFIQTELERNPVLETNENQDEPDSRESQEKEPEPDDNRDDEWKEYFQDRSDLGYSSEKYDPDNQRNLEHFYADAPTLSEHLMMQLRLSLNDERAIRIGTFLIGNIDENGYLRIGVEEAGTALHAEENQVLEVLTLIQSFDPSGVGARDIAECLLIQLTQLGAVTPQAERIVKEFLDDLGRGRLARIAAALGITVNEVQDIADLIRTLNPKPGRNFGGLQDVRFVNPDIVVEYLNGEYIILVNDGQSPRLTVNPLYNDMMRQPGMFNEETQKYIRDRINSAIWLIKSIEHRRLTLYNVAKCLVDVQRDFLEKGIKYLKPLNLKQVAEMVGMHESTVSRATNNKYIQTPRGVFELKYFFSGGLQTAEGDSQSSRSIKRMIQEMIAREDARAPLSDQKIAEVMEEKGINISRRTVAKYRGELNIPSTARRKRY